MRIPRRLGALLLLALVAGCSTAAAPSPTATPGSSRAGPGVVPFVPQIVSSQAVVGQNRFLIGLLDRAGTRPIGTPDTKVEVGFSSQPAGAGATAIPPVPASFVWAIEGERGIYVVDVDFPSAGDWSVDVTASGGAVPAGTVEVGFQVAEKGSVVPIGGAAPATRTPTAADVGGDLRQISTDPVPDPSFYTTSVDEALRKHEPFVLVFATPAFCASRQCGPTLDGVKAVAKDQTGMTFIHVEPYKLQFADGRLQPVLDANGNLQVIDAVNAWGILSEPWVFVVDRDGIVRGSYEAVISPDELRKAIDAVK